MKMEKTRTGLMEVLSSPYRQTFTAQIRQDNKLDRLYNFRDDLVEGFLEENPLLGGLLFNTHKVIREYFGPEVEMALEVVADPEALGDQQLFVLIRTKFPLQEARAHLAELDQGWWLDALPAAEGKMEIALE